MSKLWDIPSLFSIGLTPWNGPAFSTHLPTQREQYDISLMLCIKGTGSQNYFYILHSHDPTSKEYIHITFQLKGWETWEAEKICVCGFVCECMHVCICVFVCLFICASVRALTCVHVQGTHNWNSSFHTGFKVSSLTEVLWCIVLLEVKYREQNGLLKPA
jgi:hypothetical protein